MKEDEEESEQFFSFTTSSSLQPSTITSSNEFSNKIIDVNMPSVSQIVNIAPRVEVESSDSPLFGPTYPPSTSSTSNDIDLANDVTYKKMIAQQFGEETADDISIVDIDISKHLTRPNEWLKTITEERPQEYQGVAPTSTARRKHQITFLAFQAKQREIELKNEWAANKLTRSQTKAKYGF